MHARLARITKDLERLPPDLQVRVLRRLLELTPPEPPTVERVARLADATSDRHPELGLLERAVGLSFLPWSGVDLQAPRAGPDAEPVDRLSARLRDVAVRVAWDLARAAAPCEHCAWAPRPLALVVVPCLEHVLRCHHVPRHPDGLQVFAACRDCYGRRYANSNLAVHAELVPPWVFELASALQTWDLALLSSRHA